LVTLLDTKKGKLSHTMDNLESITGNLAKNNNKIDASLTNLQQLSGKMAQLKLEETLAAFKNTLSELESTLAKANNKQSSIGALLNEKKLYEEVRQTNRSLNTLLDDLKTNPKRYINVSVFGKKDRSVPLKKPIYDTLPDKGN
jgi:phospholipid/cholesterol/gamma-HCH transport system substrate-binding protein